MKFTSFILVLAGLCTLVVVAQPADPKAAAKKAFMMISMGLTPSEYDLMMAVTHCDDVQAESALKSGANPNFLGLANETQLMVVCNKCTNVKLAQLLLKYGAKTEFEDDGGYTALMYAAQENRPEMVKALLESGADPNLKADSDNAKSIGTEGFTALMFACEYASIKVVPLLLAHGADTKIVNAKGQTALDMTKQGNQEAIIKLLEGK